MKWGDPGNFILNVEQLELGEAIENLSEDELVGDGAMDLIEHLVDALRSFVHLLFGNRVDDRIEYATGDDVKNNRHVQILRQCPERIVVRRSIRLKAYRQLPILRNALQEHLRKAQADSAIETIMKAA